MAGIVAEERVYQETDDDDTAHTVKETAVSEGTTKEPVDFAIEKNFENTDDNKSDRLTRLPINKVKLIMKTDPDVTIASSDAAILIAKTAELFIQYMTEEAFKCTQRTSRKTVQKKDVEDAINNKDQFAFLDGVI